MALIAVSGVALHSHHAAAAGAATIPAATNPTVTTTVAPPVVTAPTTTVPSTVPTTTTLRRTPSTTTAARPTTSTIPNPAPAYAPAARAVSKAESCGWGWDAQHLDDGSYDGVIVSLDAPHRPSTAVAITAAPHGPSTAPTVRQVTTDSSGHASIEVRLSLDKRDWTLTVSAAFAGSTCASQSFTIVY